jgi:hypothetical protein
LGSALAQAVIRHVQRLHGASADALAAHTRLLFLRLVEDYLFMSRLRTQIMLEELPLLGAPPNMANLGQYAEPVRVMVEARLRAAASALAARGFEWRTLTAGDTCLTIGSLNVASLELPWQRLFDITLDIAIT